MIKYFYFILFLLSCSLSLHSERITLNFPHFSGSEYDFILLSGNVSDTINHGSIGSDGSLEIVIPEAYAGYRGVARWRLKGGGGLDFILTGKDFSVTCMEPSPNDDNIVYFGPGSADNVLFLKNYLEQQSLFKKIDAMQMLQDAYSDSPKSAFARGGAKELAKLKSEYVKMQQKRAASSFYADHYSRMSNLYNGWPTHRIYDNIEDSEEHRQRDVQRYIEEELDMVELYHSGMWQMVMSQFMSIYTTDSSYGAAMVVLLKKTARVDVFEKLANDLVTICEQYDKGVAGEMIVDYLMACGRIRHMSSRMEYAFAMNMLKVGAQVPALSMGAVPSGRVVLVFHETGCASCEQEVGVLIRHYDDLSKKGIQVVSISSDTDLTIFSRTALRLPWLQKYCDGRGFQGADFKSFGVFGTPTLFLIENGVLKGRYAKVTDMGIL